VTCIFYLGWGEGPQPSEEPADGPIPASAGQAGSAGRAPAPPSASQAPGPVPAHPGGTTAASASPSASASASQGSSSGAGGDPGQGAEGGPGPGGQLRLYPWPAGPPVDLEPRFNRLVLFSSARMVHRVLPSRRPGRACFTIWLSSARRWVCGRAGGWNGRAGD
jgi:hypothetical protein